MSLFSTTQSKGLTNALVSLLGLLSICRIENKQHATYWNRSPFTRGLRGSTAKSYADFAFMDSSSDISFVSSGRPSVDRYQYPPRLSSGSEGLDRSFETVRTPQTSVDSYSTRNDFSSFSQSSGGSSWSSQAFVS